MLTGFHSQNFMNLAMIKANAFINRFQRKHEAIPETPKDFTVVLAIGSGIIIMGICLYFWFHHRERVFPVRTYLDEHIETFL